MPRTPRPFWEERNNRWRLRFKKTLPDGTVKRHWHLCSGRENHAKALELAKKIMGDSGPGLVVKAPAAKRGPEWLTPGQFASLVQLSVRTVRKLLAQGRIPGALRIGEQWRINRQTWMEGGGIQAKPQEGLPAPRPKQRRVRKPRPQKRPITAAQLEALQVVSECNKNFAKAARILGKDRKTVKQLYKAAMRKAGFIACQKPRMMPLPIDRRGQLSVANEDDWRRPQQG